QSRFLKAKERQRRGFRVQLVTCATKVTGKYARVPYRAASPAPDNKGTPTALVGVCPTQRGTRPKGKMRWSRLSSLLRRLLNQVVDPRLTEILVEVAHIALGASDACPSRVGILAGARARPLDGGARAAAAFASGRLVVLYAPTSLRLPAAV